jgi:hypothetical protein
MPSYKGIITCVDGSSDSFNAGPATLVELHPRCMAKSQMYAAMALMDISQMVPSVTAIWLDDPAKLLQDIDLAYMADIKGCNDLQALLEDIEAAVWLQDRATEAQTTTGQVHMGLTTAIFMLLLVAGAGMAG